MDRLHSLIAEARRLESLSMAIYVRFAQRFSDQADLHRFWMSMARHEAGHVGALELLQVMVDAAAAPPAVGQTEAGVADAARAIESLEQKSRADVDIRTAFDIAVELEATELEDLVLDLVHGLTDSAQRDQAIQMIVHDLSDLSLMIEKHTTDDELLARADALVERHVSRRGVSGR
jgi:rubrerythrin